jgi:hypothetical protein
MSDIRKDVRTRWESCHCGIVLNQRESGDYEE